LEFSMLRQFAIALSWLTTIITTYPFSTVFRILANQTKINLSNIGSYLVNKLYHTTVELN